MGWASGSSLMSDICYALKKAKIKPKERAKIYRVLIPAFESHDCDTLQECENDDSVFRQVYGELNPGYNDDYEEECD